MLERPYIFIADTECSLVEVEEEEDSSSDDDQSDGQTDEGKKNKDNKIKKISKHVANSACFFSRSALLIIHRTSYTLLRDRTASNIW